METMHSQLLLITFFAKVVVASTFFLVTFHNERILVYCKHTSVLKRTCSHRKSDVSGYTYRVACQALQAASAMPTHLCKITTNQFSAVQLV